MSIPHFGDSCIYCGLSHDDVAPGPCLGDLTKAIPIAYRSPGVRWDKVERYLIRMSDGRVVERYEHISMQAPYWHFGYSDHLQHPPRYDERLRP